MLKLQSILSVGRRHMTIESQLFLADGEKISACLEAGESSLLIKADNIEEQWPHSLIEAKIGGAGNKLVFLSYPNSKTIKSLYFYRNATDLAVLLNLNIPNYEHLKIADRKEKRQFTLTVLSLIVLSLGLIYLVSKSWYPALDMLVDRIPYSIEKKLGEHLIKAVLPADKGLNHPKIEEILVKQLRPLIKQLPKNMQGIKLHISKNHEINAFALMGGHMIFNRGLLLRASSLEEVLGVAAHELAHIRERHSMKALVQSLGLFFAIDLLVGDIGGTIAVLIENSQMLLQKGFSRSHELEADDTGYQILKRAEVSPQGMVDFFRLLKHDAKESGLDQFSEAFAILSTHPGTTERIEKLEKRILSEKTQFPPIPFDYQNFISLLENLSDRG